MESAAGLFRQRRDASGDVVESLVNSQSIIHDECRENVAKR